MPAMIDVDVDGLLHMIKVEREQFCEAIDDLRQQYSVGASDDAADRKDWIEELEACGHTFVAGLYENWCEKHSAE